MQWRRCWLQPPASAVKTCTPPVTTLQVRPHPTMPATSACKSCLASRHANVVSASLEEWPINKRPLQRSLPSATDRTSHPGNTQPLTNAVADVIVFTCFSLLLSSLQRFYLNNTRTPWQPSPQHLQ